MRHSRSKSIGIALFVVGTLFVSGCNTPEEKALAQERADLIIKQGAIAESNKECRSLDRELAIFKAQNGKQIADVNSRWSALTDSKKKSLGKLHKDDTNSAFKAMIGPLIRCGTHFPVK